MSYTAEKEKDLMSIKNKQKVGFIPWFYWGFAAYFFFAEYIIRVSTGVMVDDLMRDFNVGALALGSLSAFFYYAYLGMQIPVGVLVDRFSPRILLSFATAICGLGALIFSHSDGVAMASLARFLLGFGGSFAFVGGLKLAATWLPQKYLGTLVGITQGLGMLGASVGEAPMSYAVHHLGWRQTVFNFAVMFFIMSIVIGIIVKDKKQKQDSFSVMQGLKAVLKKKQTWINALYAGLIFSPTAAFAELWGVSYIQGTTEFSVHQAASAVGLIFIGVTIGGPAAGWISDKIQRRRPVMMGASIACGIILPFVLYVNQMPLMILNILLFTYGLVSGGFVTSYTLATELHPKKVAGVALGFTNMASVIIGAALQPVIGALLDLRWDGTMLNGVPYYTPQNFKAAIIFLPITIVASLITAYFVKETYCKSYEERNT